MDLLQLLGDDSSFSDLTFDEKNVFKSVLQGEVKRREEAQTPVKLRETVDIKSWLDSEYYMGSDNVRIYDYWKETIADIFNSGRDKDNRISEIILGGSIGIGKSTCALIILIRRLYELSTYKNIKSLFGLMRSTTISFLYFSVNKKQAELTGFGDMRGLLDSIPYFKEHFPRNPRLDSIILFPENLLITYGSGTQHSIGMSLMGSILDEANFHRGEGKESQTGYSYTSKVSELYSSIVNRSKSRFVVDGGEDYSLNILVSSATHESSITEQRIQRGVNNPHVLVRCPTLWEVKPHNYSGKMFYICKGSASLEPFIIDSIDDVNQYKLSEGLSKCKADDGDMDFEVINKEIQAMSEDKVSRFLPVPVELKQGFETNIIQSMQDIGGISVAPSGRLFTSKIVYQECCKDSLKHPFISEVITISTGDSLRIQDYLKKDFVFKDITKPRYIHIDQSVVSDSTGISSVYVKDIIEEDGIKKSILDVDFMLRIEPPKPPKRIAIYKIRDFVAYLNLFYKLKLGKVSYDIFSSEESRQILEEMGYNVGYLSVDRNDKAYIDMITLLYEKRLNIYDYEPMKKELFALIHNRMKRKVDHPKQFDTGEAGSKDVTDSLAGAVSNALQASYGDSSEGDGVNDFLNANPLSFGSMRGGYVKQLSVDEMINQEIDLMIDNY